MTLRTIESEFSKELLEQLNEENEHDLTLDGPIMTKLHPKLIWVRLQQEFSPEEPSAPVLIPGWHFDCFENLESAVAKYPEIELRFEGRPWTFHQFMEKNTQEAMIEFGDLGTIVLSKNEINSNPGPGLYWQQLPIWTNYALSPELWGTFGKWPRFDIRLRELFQKHNLLSENSKIGYYVLKSEAAALKNFGFMGTSLDRSYVLVLPWTFSLKALEKLETTIQMEFGNVHP
jgi:hypothetical protein